MNINEYIDQCYDYLIADKYENLHQILHHSIKQHQDLIKVILSTAYQSIKDNDPKTALKAASLLLFTDNEQGEFWQAYAIAHHMIEGGHHNNFAYFDLAIFYTRLSPYHVESNKLNAITESGLIHQAKEFIEHLYQKYSDDKEKYYELINKYIALLYNHFCDYQDDILKYCHDFLNNYDNNHGSVNVVCAHVHMKNCRYENAKSFYAKRFYANNFKQWDRPALHIPIWQGENLNNKHLYIWAEQGLGDEVKFLRLLTLFYYDSVTLTIDCDKRLIPLLKRNYPHINFLPRLSNKHHNLDFNTIDYHAPMAQILFNLCQSEKDIPTLKKPFLKPHKDKIIAYQKTIAKYAEDFTKEPIIIGISWYSLLGAPFDHLETKQLEIQDHFRRNHILSDFCTMIKQALNGQPAILINLQYNFQQDDIDYYQKSDSALPIITIPNVDLVNDIEDICAILHHCDYVITIGNALAHLAGAMKKKTFIILPENAAWHYPSNKNYSVFYGKFQQTYFQDKHQTQSEYRDYLVTPLKKFLFKK